MTSKEIAELTGKEHTNVLRDIRTMLEALGMGELSFESSYQSAQGKTLPMFILPKDLTLTLVSGYSIPMRHRIVTRLEELETGAVERAKVPAHVLPTDYLSALKELITSLECQGALKVENEALKATDGPDLVHVQDELSFEHMSKMRRTTTTQAPTSMTSREISELTGKEHYNVMADIRVMLEALDLGALSFQGTYSSAQGKPLPMFVLPKDLTMTLVSGYNVVMRHRIVTRWQALEAAPRRPLWNNPWCPCLKWALKGEEA